MKNTDKKLHFVLILLGVWYGIVSVLWLETVIYINFIREEPVNQEYSFETSVAEIIPTVEYFYTQTYEALPTNIFTKTSIPTYTEIPFSTSTAAASPTNTVTPSQVPIPTIIIHPTSAHPVGATALCKDGTYSYSQNRRGTCSGHGGVSIWLY